MLTTSPTDNGRSPIDKSLLRHLAEYYQTGVGIQEQILAEGRAGCGEEENNNNDNSNDDNSNDNNSNGNVEGAD